MPETTVDAPAPALSPFALEMKMLIAFQLYCAIETLVDYFRRARWPCAHDFIGGFESTAGKWFVEAMVRLVREKGKPI